MSNLDRLINNPSYIPNNEELLEFCNKVREVAGGSIIPALLPSIRSEKNSCLVANALNFDCSVYGHIPVDAADLITYENGDIAWVMVSDDLLALTKISYTLRLKPVVTKDFHPSGTIIKVGLVLPQWVANAAKAFDNGTHFNEFAR